MNGEAVVLGFDTSCYTTSVAAVDLAGRPVASCRRLLPVPSGHNPGMSRGPICRYFKRGMPRRAAWPRCWVSLALLPIISGDTWRRR